MLIFKSYFSYCKDKKFEVWTMLIFILGHPWSSSSSPTNALATLCRHFCPHVVEIVVSPTCPSRWLRSSFFMFSSWKLRSNSAIISKCNWATIFTFCYPLMVATFSLSNISICFTTSSRPSTLCSTTFIEVLRSRITFTMDLPLLPLDLTTSTTHPLIIGFSYSMSIVVWTNYWEGGRGALFVFPIPLTLNLSCSHRLLLYPHYLLILCNSTKSYCLLVGYLLVNRQCWSISCRLHKGEGSLLIGWSFSL